MKQTWLATNRRIWTLLLIAAVVLLGFGALGIQFSTPKSTFFFFSIFLFIAGVGYIGKAIMQLMTPRLAFHRDQLLVYLAGLSPIKVPIDIVEVFFMGQGGSKLKTAEQKELENSTIVVRIAEAADEWHKREVNTKFGHWCEGYITIRGAWCEPINVDVIRRLNQQLLQAKKKHTVEQTTCGSN